jgi:hypothetical protein
VDINLAEPILVEPVVTLSGRANLFFFFQNLFGFLLLPDPTQTSTVRTLARKMVVMSQKDL